MAYLSPYTEGIDPGCNKTAELFLDRY
jgi:hypothetical protein